MQVRRYQPKDELEVIALWSEVFAETAPYNQPDRSLKAKLAVDDAIFVAELDGQVIGTTLAGYDGHRGWLYSVAVSPKARRRGVGAALIRKALNYLRQRGCPKVNLQVRPDNEGVTAFYESLGFSLEPRICMGLRIEG